MTRLDLVRGILQAVLEGFEDSDAILRDVKTEDIEKAFSDALEEETED